MFLFALQATAWAIDINQFPKIVKMGDRCRASVAQFAPYGYVPAGGGQHIMCRVNAYVGTRCYCWFGPTQVFGQVVRSSDYADVKN